MAVRLRGEIKCRKLSGEGDWHVMHTRGTAADEGGDSDDDYTPVARAKAKRTQTPSTKLKGNCCTPSVMTAEERAHAIAFTYTNHGPTMHHCSAT